MIYVNISYYEVSGYFVNHKYLNEPHLVSATLGLKIVLDPVNFEL